MKQFNSEEAFGIEKPEEKIDSTVQGVLAALEQEAAESSYYDLIPEEDLSYFDMIVEKNRPYYPGMSEADVREMLARNYLGRIRIFESVVTARGFEQATEFSDPKLEGAALTRSGSYVFMGKGVLAPQGGDFTYFKIEGRKAGPPSVFMSGVRVLPAQIGDRLNILSGAPIASTSTLKSIFVRNLERQSDKTQIIDVSAEVRNATQILDGKTLLAQLRAAREAGE